jgi:hypothetical protein
MSCFSMAAAFHEVLATVRQTAAAHASALDELERVFSAQTVSVFVILKEKNEFQKKVPVTNE